MNIKLNKCKPGDKVKFGLYGPSGVELLIGTYLGIHSNRDNSGLIGWHSSEEFPKSLKSWQYFELAGLKQYYRGELDWRNNSLLAKEKLSEYKFGYWLPSNLLVELAFYNAEQKCVVCKRSAPHEEKKNFTCAFCLTLRDIEIMDAYNAHRHYMIIRV